MEILHTVVEAVFVSFLMGAIVGGAIIAHFLYKPAEKDADKLQAVKIKVSDHEH